MTCKTWPRCVALKSEEASPKDFRMPTSSFWFRVSATENKEYKAFLVLFAGFGLCARNKAVLRDSRTGSVPFLTFNLFEPLSSAEYISRKLLM